MMIKLLLASAVALVLGSPAHAYTDAVCQFGIGVGACQPRTHNPDARVIAIPPEVMISEDPEARRAWQARCNPVLSARDPNTGMQRWLWSAKGCEYGP